MPTRTRPRDFLKPIVAAILGGLALTAALAPVSAQAWWQDNWKYRKALTIDTSTTGANIAEAAGRTPVLVKLESPEFDFASALDNGQDLQFVAADDKTVLKYHIESYDSTLGSAKVWVDVPNVGGGQKTQLWIYSGNKDATPSVDTKGSFDPDYVLVFHFDGDAAQPVADKTAYGNNTEGPPSGIDEGGIIGHAAKFTPGKPLQAPASPSLTFAAGAPFTISLWVKQDVQQPDAELLGRHEVGGQLAVGLASGVPYAQIGGVRLQAPKAVWATYFSKEQATSLVWTHLALVSDGKTATLYVNGENVASAPAPTPALSGPIVIGGTGAAGFAGEMDELRVSKIARPLSILQADLAAQASGGKLLAFGQNEQQGGGGGYFGIIVKSVTVDAWVIIGLLGIMFAVTVFVVVTKSNYLSVSAKANDLFVDRYNQLSGDLDKVGNMSDLGEKEQILIAKSPIYRIFKSGHDEIAHRISVGRRVSLRAEGLEVVRALMDSTIVRENQKLQKNMVLLTLAISGGPFLGLLGTVVGVMITFAAIAAAGDVNVNAIAPGISAALLATVTGLAVAIPALFAYNYLLVQAKNVTANMQVFVDEFVTRVAETFSEPDQKEAAE